MKLFYLGPEQSFSHQAARLSMSDESGVIEYIPKVPLENVVKSLYAEGDNTDMAIIPYYNFLEGLVQESLDLIYENQVYIIGAQRVPIVFCIAGYDQDLERTGISSHPKALAQCSQYLNQHYPNIPHFAVSSTTEGARIVRERHSGFAIASKEGVLQYGLTVIKEDVGNTKHGKTNFTDFFLLAQQDIARYNEKIACFTMIAVTPYIDRVGLLQEILAQISFYNLNLAKIHSRPAIDEVGNLGVEPQMFYLEIVCHKDCEDFKHCVDALEYKFTPKNSHLSAVRILGSYPACSQGCKL